jgi:hypothetical protein
MLLVAQRIDSALQSVHAYLYLHRTGWGGAAPPVLALPEAELVHRREREPSGSHPLRSYLSLLAPDDVTPSELTQLYAGLHSGRLASTPLPWIIRLGRGLAEFGIDAAAAPVWRAELQLLFFDAAALLTEWRTRAP